MAPSTPQPPENQPFIHRLPNELLSDIFLEALPPFHWPREKGSERGLLRYRALLGSICKLWRIMLHTTPFLWQVIVFRSSRTSSRAELGEKMFKHALVHSALVKLDLVVIFDGPGVEPSPEIFELIRAVMRRTQSLKVWRRESSISTVGIFPLPDVPHLKELSVELDDNYTNVPTDFIPVVKIFNDSDANTSVPLTHFRFHGTQTSVQIPALDHKTLNVFHYDRRAIVGDLDLFVKHAPNLEHLNVSGGYIRSYHLDSTSLTHLTFEALLNESEQLNFGNLPNLKFLDLKGVKPGGVLPSHIAVSPTFPTLQTLILSIDGGFWLSRVLFLMQEAPCLIGLEIWDIAAAKAMAELTPHHRGEGEGGRPWSSLRLFRIGLSRSGMQGTREPVWRSSMSELAKRLVDKRPELRIELHVEKKWNGKPPSIYFDAPDTVFKTIISRTTSGLEPPLGEVIETLT